MVQALTGIEAQLRVRQSGVCCVRCQMEHCLRAISDNLTAALALELRGRSASTKHERERHRHHGAGPSLVEMMSWGVPSGRTTLTVPATGSKDSTQPYSCTRTW